MKTEEYRQDKPMSVNFVVDEETNAKYIAAYGFPAIDGVPIECGGVKCIVYHAESDDYWVLGYDNNEEYLKSVYKDMSQLEPKLIQWC